MMLRTSLVNIIFVPYEPLFFIVSNFGRLSFLSYVRRSEMKFMVIQMRKKAKTNCFLSFFLFFPVQYCYNVVAEKKVLLMSFLFRPEAVWISF